MNTGHHRLLLIETDPVYREVTAYRLELLGYTVCRAGSILDAWREIEMSRPHAILLTMDDSRLDPMDLLEQFASDNETAATPLLVMSKEADLDRVEASWRAGAVDYLVTPYDPVSLEKKVTRLLDGIVPTPIGNDDFGHARALAEGPAEHAVV